MSNKQLLRPCPKDRACTFKDLQPCDDCEVGGDRELVEENKALKKQIDGFWDAVYYGYLIETREEIEKDCKESWAEGTSPMAVAAHFMWKREPKVKELVEALEKISGGVMSMYLCQSDMIKDFKRTAIDVLAKHKAKNN